VSVQEALKFASRDQRGLHRHGQPLSVVARGPVSEWFVGSSIRVSSADADLFADATGKKGATFTTSSPDSVPERIPSQRGCHPAVENGGQLRNSSPSSPEKTRRAGSTASAAASSRSSSPGARRTEYRARLVSRHRRHSVNEEIAAGLSTVTSIPRDVATPSRRIRRRSPRDDLRIRESQPEHGAPSSRAKRDSVIGRERDKLLAQRSSRGGPHRGRSESSVFVDSSEHGVVAPSTSASLAADRRARQRRRSPAFLPRSPDSDACRLSGLELLDGTLETRTEVSLP